MGTRELQQLVMIAGTQDLASFSFQGETALTVQFKTSSGVQAFVEVAKLQPQRLGYDTAVVSQLGKSVVITTDIQ